MKERTPIRHVLILLLLMMVLGVAANFISMGFWGFFGHTPESMLELRNMTADDRFLFRIGLMINHVGMFFIPAVVFGMIYHRHRFIHYLRLDEFPKLGTAIYWAMLILFSYPLVGFLTQVNELLPLPQWANNAQDEAFGILSNILTMEGTGELIVALILVAVLPAIGEEFVFRGVIQQKLEEAFGNPHLAILAASLLFGMIHFQLERILPLSFLGFLLGYSFYYTRTLALPILLHFFINGTQVIALFALDEFKLENLQEAPDVPVTLVIGSTILIVVFVYYSRRLQTRGESTP